MTNIDNITCDQVPYLIEELMKLGAKNVHVIPALTKKGRSEYVFLIDSEERNFEKLAEFMALETGTLGVRLLKTEHYPFDYELRKLCLSFRDENGLLLWEGDIDIKIVIGKEQKPLSARVEYEELKELASRVREAGLKLSMYEIKELIEERALKGIKDFTVNFNDCGMELGSESLFPVSKKLYCKDKTKTY
ncbi:MULTISPECIES: nickel insertion protein [unclassified Methanosarcina]|uniref:nickel insertion protein n=1 Tax=unclassified Methanosarcina TaxID=2644672 RepID=UPI001E486B75|nr:MULTISPECIES: nickel insertion protein [unclassified Methanosarcina]